MQFRLGHQVLIEQGAVMTLSVIGECLTPHFLNRFLGKRIQFGDIDGLTRLVHWTSRLCIMPEGGSPPMIRDCEFVW